MNFDGLISFLGHSNWGFVVLWLVLLGIAFAACFSENTVPSTSHHPANRTRR